MYRPTAKKILRPRFEQIMGFQDLTLSLPICNAKGFLPSDVYTKKGKMMHFAFGSTGNYKCFTNDLAAAVEDRGKPDLYDRLTGRGCWGALVSVKINWGIGFR